MTRMRDQLFSTPFRCRFFFFVAITVVALAMDRSSAAPPVARSVHYDGSGGNVQTYPYDPLMNTNVAMSIEAWVYREDSSRCETILSHDFRSSFWFGFCNNLRF